MSAHHHDPLAKHDGIDHGVAPERVDEMRVSAQFIHGNRIAGDGSVVFPG
jgi:hypothetical protein